MPVKRNYMKKRGLLAAASMISAAQAANPGGYEVVGDSLVSAQMAFLGRDGNVWIVDKTENNPAQINGHPAWAAVYNPKDNTAEPKDVVTNSFCAGGAVLGDGRWLNVGGNQAVTHGGAAVNDYPDKPNPYQNEDGGEAIRLLDLAGSKEWSDNDQFMTGRRWYPTVETLGGGDAIIMGGDQWGGYINGESQNNPTYEFYPPRDGDPVDFDFLGERTMPINLYPLAYLLPSGRLFVQAMYAAIVWDIDQKYEAKTLPDIPHAARAYPASGATAVLPLTPENDYNPSFMFCGGQDIPQNGWGDAGGPGFDITKKWADKSCVKIQPEGSDNPEWEEDDELPEPRTMGNFIYLPNGKLVLLNGGAKGSAGYGNDTWAVGQSYADDPTYMPLIFDPSAPKGERISRDGLDGSDIARLYHSVATLLEDGSVWVSGSNPNVDVIQTPDRQWNTDYRVERWYPTWYNEPRPQPQGLPDTLSYGGDSFDIHLSASDLKGDSDKLKNVKAAVIRPGFSTHAMNFGQRYLELRTSFTATSAEEGVLHVSQMPNNANIFQPGPALIFITVDGIPSYGHWVTVGSGEIGVQPTHDNSQLPESSVFEKSNSNAQDSSSAWSSTKSVYGGLLIGALGCVASLVDFF
ncbi:hypothetical protein E3P99_03633 [Wallemia hederae]|uniref:Galactose oxidase-like Early set domain-containing protein n=1 Tax=Wallemia hederae TaxID=1540922 RepID=A0A4T0FEG4_9BASI|nr:hypothetical protein E3P99_03633 [Wallemia hederae]